MRTLLMGDMKRIEAMFHCLSASSENFEIELIISENDFVSQYYSCPIESLDAVQVLKNEWDIIFVCSQYFKEIKELLLAVGISENIIMPEKEVRRFLTKKEIMEAYARQIKDVYQSKYVSDHITVGEFTYGTPNILDYYDGTRLTIGKFCSIALDCTIMLGGEHRGDWCTTYPFNKLLADFRGIQGNPKSKGDIVIGNDVWLAKDCKILSGVHIGDGCIIGMGAVVTKDIAPYSVVGGIPAKTIKKRFDKATIKKLEEIQWWNWDKEHLYDVVPILQSNNLQKLFEYYDRYCS